MILRRNSSYACILMFFVAAFAQNINPKPTSSADSAEKTSTIMELPAKSNGRMPLKIMAAADTFSGSYTFLIERLAPSLPLLTVRASDSKRILANCQFDNRPFDNNNNKNNYESRWLTFEWQIEGGLLRCHTPESETFFKLDEPVVGNTPVGRSAGYAVEVVSANATICVRDLMTPGLMAPLRCTTAMMAPHGVQCGCSLLDAPAADFFDAANAEFPLLHNIVVSPSNSGSPLPSPVAFPMFRPEPSSRAAHLPQPTDSGLDNSAPVFDHLKVVPLVSAAAIPSTIPPITTVPVDEETTPTVSQIARFTPAPEIRIRGTRPSFHAQNRRANATDPSTTVARATLATTEPDVVDISDMSAINEKVPADFAVEAEPRTVATITALTAVCSLKCEMGGVCVLVQNGGPVCRCPAGFLGRNCNIRNPCVNMSTCTDHYGPVARCIVDADAMAEKAPSVFVEAPHLCYCRDDNNDWKSCDELFNMEFGPAVIDKTTSSTTFAPTEARPAVVDELGAFRRLTANSTITVDDSTTAPSHSPSEFPFPEFPLHHNATSPSEKSSEPRSIQRSSIDSNGGSSRPTFTILPVENSANLSSAPTTLIHLATPMTVATTVFVRIAEDATSQRAPIAVALPIPTGAENELKPKTSVRPPTVDTTIISKEQRTTTLIDTEGDNGFERITQHIHESSRVDTTNEMTKSGNKEDEFEKVLPSEERFASQEEHEDAFMHNNFITSDATPPEAEIEDGLDTTTVLAVTKITPIVTTQVTNISPAVADFETGQPNRPPAPAHVGTPHRSAFQSSAASWIIGVGALGILIIMAAGGACVGRYVRRSRRLHGKYNPSREESALATAYAMPMTTVGKEERLI